MVAEISRLAPSDLCGESILELSMIWPCTAIVELCGSRLSRAEKYQERFPIIKLLSLTIRQSYLEEFRITQSARKRSNLTPRSWAGISLSNLVISQNQEMTTHSLRLTTTVSSYLAGSWQEQESTKLTSALKMEAPWNGSVLQSKVLAHRLPVHHKALLITKASCIFLEEWMRTTQSFQIFGSLICRPKPGRRSVCQRVHHFQDLEAVTAQAYSKIRCTSSEEFWNWRKNLMKCSSITLTHAPFKSLAAMVNLMKISLKSSQTQERWKKKMVCRQLWEETPWTSQRKECSTASSLLRNWWTKAWENSKREKLRLENLHRRKVTMTRRTPRKVDWHHQHQWLCRLVS